MRIAALDDDPLQLEMLRQVALETGHSCHTYQTGSALQLELRRES
ncbi:MAG: DNA-binding response regulator, partial [Delftia sp.]|nr:DNA-binding response regulator [Delftia sp.]